jgi:hypothetical protein
MITLYTADRTKHSVHSDTRQMATAMGYHPDRDQIAFAQIDNGPVRPINLANVIEHELRQR